MPGQLLQGPQVDAGPAAQREVGMPQRVKVREQRSIRSRQLIADAGRFQVQAKHLRALAVPRPCPAPNWLPGRLIAEEGTQQVGQVWCDWLHLQHSALV